MKYYPLGLTILNSITDEIVDVYCWESVFKDEKVVQYFLAFKNPLNKVIQWYKTKGEVCLLIHLQSFMGLLHSYLNKQVL